MAYSVLNERTTQYNMVRINFQDNWGAGNMDYSEKRNYIRVKTKSKIEYREIGSEMTHLGQCINVSTGGVLFNCSHNIVPGTTIEISIKPEQKTVAPLDATVKVVRAQTNDNGGFNIAGKIKELI